MVLFRFNSSLHAKNSKLPEKNIVKVYASMTKLCWDSFERAPMTSKGAPKTFETHGGPLWLPLPFLTFQMCLFPCVLQEITCIVELITTNNKENFSASCAYNIL